MMIDISCSVSCEGSGILLRMKARPVRYYEWKKRHADTTPSDIQRERETHGQIERQLFETLHIEREKMSTS